MKKADKLNLAFGKCFNKSRLVQEECNLILDISILDLMTKHGFNEIQSREIKLWCDLECKRTKNNYSLESRSELEHTDTGYFRT